jgi:UDPglucose 6-dehydrogenase
MNAITVIGGGYVGLITSAGFARLGHQVYCLEIDHTRADLLREDRLPIKEPGLGELWERGRESGRLKVANSYREAMRDSAFVFLAVGTPSRSNGSVDLRQVISAVRSVADAWRGDEPPVIVLKSTVPPGTAELVADVWREHRPGEEALVVSNPEFLREGQAVFDFMRPTRIVIGAGDRETAEKVGALYEGLRRPVVYTSTRAAEMIKYASNAFLCTKVSFINEIAALCEEIGVDIVDVSEALGMDPRVGSSYLEAGLGWGGSCLPKDIGGLIWSASRLGVHTPVLSAAVKINKRQVRLVASRLESLIGDLAGKTIAVWGLAFKPNCDDIRESPALALLRLLGQSGCKIRAYDPLAMDETAKLFPEVEYCAGPYEAATGADAIVLATAWSHFQSLDFDRLRALVRRPLILDGRNALDGVAATDAGFIYVGIGRTVTGPEFEPEIKDLLPHVKRPKPRTKARAG